MKDLEIILENKPGELAKFGKIMGDNQISLEGGGTFQIGNFSIAHFLVKEPEKATFTLENAGFSLNKVHEVLILKLRQDVPGQLGTFCNLLAESNVNILTQYSDHDNQLILIVDNYKKGKEIAVEWMKKWWGSKN